jgi:hypothetical protein
MATKLREKLESAVVVVVVALVIGGGYMLAYGWSWGVMKMGGGFLALGAVGVVAIIAYVAIKNFGPLELPKPEQPPRDQE